MRTATGENEKMRGKAPATAVSPVPKRKVSRADVAIVKSNVTSDLCTEVREFKA